MYPTRRAICIGFGAATLLSSFSVSAETQKLLINTLAGKNLAIHGYDPVAYFTDGGPRKGRADLTLTHGGAVWRFSSETNKKLFAESPARYLPVYGGHCAYGVARGYLVKIDPDAWSIVDGRLYLNFDRSVQTEWLKDVGGYVTKADGNWSRLASHD